MNCDFYAECTQVISIKMNRVFLLISFFNKSQKNNFTFISCVERLQQAIQIPVPAVDVLTLKGQTKNILMSIY
jgi:hypothetical protein